MKHLAYLYKIIVISLSIVLFVPQVAFADTAITVSNNADGSTNNVSVNSQSNGQSITCINGNCTSSGGGSKSTVCVNGHCTTTTDGSVDYNSPDGHTHVQVNDNTSGNGITISPAPTAGASAVSPVPTDTPEPTITPDPTITKMRDDINKQVEKDISNVKEHVKSQNAAISDFIKAEMNALQNLLNTMFK